MEDNEEENLDIEYKRYLQIMRPHLEKIVQSDVIDICNDWIQKLTNCKIHEKHLRNKYVFELCYQLAKGILEKPFIDPPPQGELVVFTEESSDVSNSEVECIVIDSEDENSHIESTDVLYKSRFVSSDYFSRNSLETCHNSDTSKCRTRILTPKEITEEYYDKSIFCYMCPEMKISNSITEKDYKSRAHNLIDKLRDMKKQNILLHNELKILKEETRNNIKNNEFFTEVLKLDAATSTISNESNVSISSLNKRLKEVQESRNNLIKTVHELQEKIDKFNEIKKTEIEDVEAKHKLEIKKVTTTIQNELKETYENKLKDLKCQQDEVIKKLNENTANDIQNMIEIREKIVNDKDEVIKLKDAEINQLRIKLEDAKIELKKIMNTYEKADEDSSRSVERKMVDLEKRLNKAEKSKMKCAKIYESKLAYFQREKHLMECSLQLHLLRQRTQIINQVADENQTELISGLEKLESKYKEIVANMQATAIQRRIQDQVAIESIFQASCNVRGVNVPINTRAENRSQLSGKTILSQNFDENRNSEEMSSVLRGDKVENVRGNKSFPEDSTMAGYYLDRERLGELFERVYIPQRDTSDRQK